MLVIGLTAAALGAVGLAVDHTLLDAGGLAAAAGDVRASAPVHDELVRQVRAAVSEAVPVGTVVDDATLDRVAAATVADPEFGAAFDRAWRAWVRGLHPGGGDTVEIDGTLVGRIVAQELAAAVPDAATRGVTSVQAPVTLRPEYTPDTAGWSRSVRVPALALLGAGFVLVAIGIAVAPMRGAAIARTGRWIAGTAVFVLGLTVAVPRLCSWIGGWPDAAGALLGGTGRSIVLPTIVLGLAGALVFLIGSSWQRTEERVIEVPVTPTGRPNVATHVGTEPGAATILPRRGRDRPHART